MLCVPQFIRSLRATDETWLVIFALTMFQAKITLG